METIVLEPDLKNKLSLIFENNKKYIFKNYSNNLKQLKEKAFEVFDKKGFPHSKIEEWRFTNLSEALKENYNFNFTQPESNIDIEKFFKCDVPDLDTFTVVVYDGWFVYKNNPLTKLENGVIVGSFAKAIEEYPDLIEKHFSKYASIENNSLIALNTAFSQDGVFIYVPDNVKLEKAIQIINILKPHENFFVQPRNLVILGKNSKLTLVNCGHSLNHKICFTNIVSEIYVDKNANLDYYNLQNEGHNSNLIDNIYIHQEENSKVSTNTLTLNAGLIRNNLNVNLAGEYSEASLYGIYLLDKTQHVDNHTYINHQVPNCKSSELYKGIIDNKAKAVFNGKVFVSRNAQKTEAYQSNKNILITDDAQINSMPQLEIYADDVKCSHGATVGQLDSEAMFYLRSRGLDEDCAKMLLMYAFASEVIDKISINVLRERISDMVNKRLRGELSVCDRCVLHCENKNEIKFEIDMSKI